ncbi:hypothetical protein BJX61DRAFT_325006 [Aspergillus egyptiacus]|nr:hypothetical protein BJX61DRAFT_325006 [Aspergillus egyptiacus]
MNLLAKLRGTAAPKPALYGLDHALLNIPIPPPSMWMNLGYWKNTTDFPTACAALLDQVLITANLLDEDGGPLDHAPIKRFHLLDVGIGCGDQSVRILNYKRTRPRKIPVADTITDEAKAGKQKGESGNEKQEPEPEPLFDSYVGLTSLPVQASFAAKRVEALQPTVLDGEEKTRTLSISHSDSTTTTNTGTGTAKQTAKIFCADAANPSTWNAEIHSAIRHTRIADTDTEPETKTPATQSTQEEEKEKEKREEEPYLLALDTLYHFTPSRTPLFRYAHSQNTNIMAFDLLLPSKPLSLLQRLLLRLICFLTGAPYGNFLTQEEYAALLVGSGYDREKIVFRDISGDVFAGIARYMRDRETSLRMYGMGKGMGKFRGAGRVFGWWARSGVVRGVVVVARV